MCRKKRFGAGESRACWRDGLKARQLSMVSCRRDFFAVVPDLCDVSSMSTELLSQPSPSLNLQIEQLCHQLKAFHGYRTVWLASDGQLWHAEPDDMLEDLGHWYVGTYLRPSPDAVTESIESRFFAQAC